MQLSKSHFRFTRPFYFSGEMVSRAVDFSFTVFGAIFSLLTAVIFTYLYIRYIVLKSQTLIEVQDVLKFYILMEIVNGLVVGFHFAHSSIVYDIDDTEVYVTPLLFWNSALLNITSILRPIAILTLGLDRIFIIIFPTTAETKRKTLSFFIGVNLMTISTVLIVVIRILPNIPVSEYVTNCITFYCLAKVGSSSVFTTLRMVFGSSNFIVGAILLIMLKKRFEVMNVVHIKNKNMMLVILTLLSTIVWNFLPNLIGFIVYSVSCRISDETSYCIIFR